MIFLINYKRSVLKELNNIDKVFREHIILDLESKLSSNSEFGEALTGQFKGLQKIRIGDWRVIYSTYQESILIFRT